MIKNKSLICGCWLYKTGRWVFQIRTSIYFFDKISLPLSTKKELIFFQTNKKGCKSNFFSCLFRKQYNKNKTICSAIMPVVRTLLATVTWLATGIRSGRVGSCNGSKHWCVMAAVKKCSRMSLTWRLHNQASKKCDKDTSYSPYRFIFDRKINIYTQSLCCFYYFAECFPCRLFMEL